MYCYTSNVAKLTLMLEQNWQFLRKPVHHHMPDIKYPLNPIPVGGRGLKPWVFLVPFLTYGDIELVLCYFS